MAERTDKDYAIEHAGYLAHSARYLLACLNELDTARLTHEERDDDASRDDLEAAGETAAGARNSLRNAIYEFEKRRDRALGVPEGEAARQQWDVKCAKCKKPGHQHNSITRACPVGRKHRTFGYSSFSSKDVFTDPRTSGVDVGRGASFSGNPPMPGKATDGE